MENTKIAKKGARIEYVPEAIEDAKVNSQVNNIENTLFYAGDSEDLLTALHLASNSGPETSYPRRLLSG